MPFTVEVALRLLLSVGLGGLIGYERENTNRPAGFRTHILVCVGSALVMITSEFIFNRYTGLTNIDPTRLGAQVVSGIGFLGAGTIIRDGFNVRGLTTAASLWAVSCVGIAVGSGFYIGAVIATIFIYLILISLKSAEKRITKRNRYRTFIVETDSNSGQVSAVCSLMEQYKIDLRSVELYKSKEGEQRIKLMVKMPGSTVDMKILSDIQALDGVQKVSEE
ncbi:MAG: MgtC/SapB family protein [Clostridiaceae bacterium]|jgi:putative Mg2+ transporter-C (MgtC) family protein|nr:MgtC/SapB family protein [Clostridiaceae bacterium]